MSSFRLQGVLGWFGVIDAVQFVDDVLIMSNVVLCGSVYTLSV